MDATQRLQAESLARDFAKDWTTIEEVNGFFRAMMKSALEQMLNSEMDVHLGRRQLGTTVQPALANDARLNDPENAAGAAQKRSPN